MAESIVESLVGGEAEGVEKDDVEPVGAPALAAAIAVQLGAADPAFATSASAFLDAQARLLDMQQAHLPEEVRLRLAAMRGALREARVRRVGQIFRVAMQGLVALLVGALVVAFGFAVSDALRADGVVIEPFDAPPALAARGLTGRVVAAGVLDTLKTIQDRTRSIAAKRNISDAWTGDIKVEIPETGLSVGEVGRLLKERLGRETHVTGDLVQESDGRLTLSVRGDGVQPKSFSGGANDLPALEVSAAEYVYGSASPYLYTAYLIQTGRPAAEALAFVSRAYAQAGMTQRPLLLLGWGLVLSGNNDRPDAIVKFRQAVLLQPDLWNGWANLMANVLRVDGEEATLQVSREYERTAAEHRATPDDVGLAIRFGQGLRQDWTAFAAAHAAAIRKYGTRGLGKIDANLSLAESAIELHDWVAATRDLAAADPSVPDTRALGLLSEGRRLIEGGRPAEATVPLAAFDSAIASDAALRNNYLDDRCFSGLADALVGRPADAEAVFDRSGRWVKCYSFHADNLEHQGRRADADAAYARAVALAPSLPFAYHRWGLALLARGDAAGALVKFAAASARGPHWADPLKGAGDALVRQHRMHEARAKYIAAIPYAPHWAALIAAARDAGVSRPRP